MDVSEDCRNFDRFAMSEGAGMRIDGDTLIYTDSAGREYPVPATAGEEGATPADRLRQRRQLIVDRCHELALVENERIGVVCREAVREVVREELGYLLRHLDNAADAATLTGTEVERSAAEVVSRLMNHVRAYYD